MVNPHEKNRNPRIPNPPPPPHLSKDQKAIWPHKMPAPPPAPGSAEELAARDAQDASALEQINTQAREQEAARIQYIETMFGKDALEKMVSASKTMQGAAERNMLAIAVQKISPQEKGEKVTRYLDIMRSFSQWFGVTKGDSTPRTLNAKDNLGRAIRDTVGGNRKAYNESTVKPIASLDEETRQHIADSTKLVPGRELYRIMQEDLEAIGKGQGSTREKSQAAHDYLDTMDKFTTFFNTMVPHNIRDDAQASLEFTGEHYDTEKKT
jgi:hypothetical protein